MTKDFDIYKYLYKLSAKDTEYITNQLGRFDSLPEGYVSDGWGNLYKIPEVGKLPLISVTENPFVKFTYNWADKVIEIYIKDDSNDYEYLDAMALRPEDFIDGPQYWFKKVAYELDDDIQAELDNIKANISEDNKYNNNFQYVINISIDDNYMGDDIKAIYNAASKVFSATKKIYQQDIKVFSDSSELNSGLIHLIINSPIELSKDDIVEFFFDYEDYLHQMVPNSDFKLEIENAYLA